MELIQLYGTTPNEIYKRTFKSPKFTSMRQRDHSFTSVWFNHCNFMVIHSGVQIGSTRSARPGQFWNGNYDIVLHILTCGRIRADIIKTNTVIPSKRARFWPQIPTTDILQFAREGEICGVFRRFKLRFVLCVSHCNTPCNKMLYLGEL